MPEQNVRKATILIVEDNEINREILKEILCDDYNVIEAVDGVDGLEKLRANYRELSLMLLDIEMPRMNGYEVLEHYSADPQLTGVPVIVITGNTLTENEEKCLLLGASDFITKPFNPNIVLRRVEAFIRLRESIRTLSKVEFDEHSGLYTRTAFNYHAHEQLLNAGDLTYSMCLIYIEDYSFITEIYGEAVGEALVRHLHDCMKRFLGERNYPFIAGRYNADHIVLLKPHSPDEPKDLCEQFDELLHQDAPVDFFSVKFAVYHHVNAGMSIRMIFDRLTISLSAIRKQYGKLLVEYDEKMMEKMRHRQLLADCMEDSLREGHFKVYYQPKHDPYTGEISGAEALVRWIHPQYGFLSPGDFIPLFEENGFITKLDLYVWQQTCRDLARWKNDGLPVVPVSVNSSRRDLMTDGFLAGLEQSVRDTGVDRELLHIEITESMFMDNESIMPRIRAIRDAGFDIELDDFGSGYSSLGIITDIPMNVLKLDASFSRQIDKQREIVRMVISIAHAIGVKVVAEGVEDDHQLDILRQYGCDCIQGYYYSKPLPVDAFEKYISA